MARRMFGRVVFLGALCVLYATAAHAQAVYGSLVGNVTDTTGGAIPGATVTATQIETNLTRETVTGAITTAAVETGRQRAPRAPGRCPQPKSSHRW